MVSSASSYQQSLIAKSCLRRALISFHFCCVIRQLKVAIISLILYSYWRSSCSFRAQLLSTSKALNPVGFVPVLVDGNLVISDSVAIIMVIICFPSEFRNANSFSNLFHCS
ncbi:hypothetical protein K1719_037102 [Acacia pycnantha]|nr:hypothetical protein K1719_037102 [Acacia pycnantha]